MNILNRLTIKHLVMNKKRTIVTIIGVMLSCALMVGIGLLFSSVRTNMLQGVVGSNGSYHVLVPGIEASKYSILEHNVNVKEYATASSIGFAKIPSNNVNKPYLYITAVNSTLLNTLELKSGRMPENNEEIVLSSHLFSDGGVTYQVGDQITLDIGKRYVNGEPIVGNDYYYNDDMGTETLKKESTKTYRVVGITNRSFYEDYSSAGYMAFTKLERPLEGTFQSYITFKSTKNIYQKGNQLAELLGVENIVDGQSTLQYNDSLLVLYGQSKYSNVISTMGAIICIILFLIATGCIIVIYNSFAISVMERKKQFGLFSSIGATKKQLQQTVFFEAFLIGIIGIPLGLFAGCLGIWIVIQIVNALLPTVFEYPLVFSIYPLFLLIPIFFMVAVIWFSAYLPARRASKITPIAAIRQNDDIKIKNRRLKTGWISRHLFGIEGEIAIKNMKRNKKKYRITIISLVVSIVLFLSFSSLMEYGLKGTEDFLMTPDYDISVYLSGYDEKREKEVIQDIITDEEVDQFATYRRADVTIPRIKQEDYHTNVQKYVFSYDSSNNATGFDLWASTFSRLALYIVDDDTYQAYLKQLGLKEEMPIFVNQFRTLDYSDQQRKVVQSPLLTSLKNGSFSLCDTSKWKNYDQLSKEMIQDANCSKQLKVYETKTMPLGLVDRIDSTDPIIVINEKQFLAVLPLLGDLNSNDSDRFLFLKSSNSSNLTKKLSNYEENSPHTFQYENVAEAQQLQKNMILVVGILLYGFIGLVTLIGVTSVFNTIHTSIALRRKEFAMLRSMGLTPKGFNRILNCESILFGVKSLLYGIPLSCIVSLLLWVSLNGVVTTSFIIPWKSLFIAVFGVFAIVYATMMYASSRIKRENILDAIREENI